MAAIDYAQTRHSTKEREGQDKAALQTETEVTERGKPSAVTLEKKTAEGTSREEAEKFVAEALARHSNVSKASVSVDENASALHENASTPEEKAAVLEKLDEDVEGEEEGISAVFVSLIVLGVILVLAAGFFSYRAYADKSSADEDVRDTNVTPASAAGSDVADMV